MGIGKKSLSRMKFFSFLFCSVPFFIFIFIFCFRSFWHAFSTISCEDLEVLNRRKVGREKKKKKRKPKKNHGKASMGRRLVPNVFNAGGFFWHIKPCFNQRKEEENIFIYIINKE